MNRPLQSHQHWLARPHPFHQWAAVIAGTFLAALVVGPTAAIGAAEVVISQLYGGGGNSGAVYRNDFVELFNRGEAPISINGWSLQYSSAAGTSWQVVPLGGTLDAGKHYLVQLTSGGNNGVPLPEADATNSLNLSASAGKVALLRSTTPLSGTCPTNTGLEDLVGYGSTASCWEGTSTALPGSAVMALFRAGDGCSDSDNNRADFFTSTPAPRSLGAPATQCAGVRSPQAIHDLQGSGLRSPFSGRTILTTTNVVTALRNDGFFIQARDAEADGDPATSEAIFVETPAGPPAEASVGREVVVAGFVEEYSPTSDLTGMPRTQLINATVTPHGFASGLPAPVPVSAAGLVTPPETSAWLERFEAMRVRIESLTVVGATEGFLQESTAFGISDGLFHAVPRGWQRPMREPGIPLSEPLPANAPPGITRFDGNPERLRVDSNAQPGAPRIEVAAGSVVADLTGVLDSERGTWTLLPDVTSGHKIEAAAPFSSPAPTMPDEWMVASWNLQRFFDTEDDPAVEDVVLTPAAFQGRLNKASSMILQRLGAPDILGVVEVENLPTLRALAAHLNASAAAAGRNDLSYAAWLEEGSDIGGIDSGFLVNTSRVQVVQVVQIGRDATYVNPATGLPQLLHDRPPLLLRARTPGSVTDEIPPTAILLNHLRSMSGIADTADGARVRAKRQAQAEHVARIVQERQMSDPPENVIVLGDFNAFDFNDGYVDVMGTIRGQPAAANDVTLASADLVEPDLLLLTGQLPATERYSYVFDGNAQAIDHILISRSLCPRLTRHGFIRGNADAPESFRGNFNRPERTSDHDAVAAWFTTTPAPRVMSATLRSDGAVELLVLSQPEQATHVECSSDFQNWIEIGTVLTDACGRGTYVHIPPPGNSARFLRLKR